MEHQPRATGSTVACPLCGSSECYDLGPVLNNDTYSGDWNQKDSLPATSLMGCNACSFQFKHPPVIPGERLADYYATVAQADWGSVAWRGLDVLPDIADKNVQGRRILDVGCAAGDILMSFPNEWQKFGIEPSRQTSEIARTRGIAILAPSLDQMPAGTEPFDAVLLIDVAEHVIDPTPLFTQIRGAMRAGGVCIVVTGDTDAPAWRLERGLYWYCAIPEHISFYNRRSMAEIERRTGFELIEHRRITHAKVSTVTRMSQVSRNLAYLALRRVGGLGIPRLRRRVLQGGAPNWSANRDHMIHVMRAV